MSKIETTKAIVIEYNTLNWWVNENLLPLFPKSTHISIAPDRNIHPSMCEGESKYFVKVNFYDEWNDVYPKNGITIEELLQREFNTRHFTGHTTYTFDPKDILAAALHQGDFELPPEDTEIHIYYDW